MDIVFSNHHLGMRLPQRKSQISCNRAKRTDNISCVIPQLIDEFTCENISTDTAKKIVKIHSDIYLLFNQTRIENTIGRNAYKHFVENMYQRSGSSLPPNANFNDIAKTIKSRYIQSPSELRSYIYSLDESMRDLLGYYSNPNDTLSVDISQTTTE